MLEKERLIDIMDNINRYPFSAIIIITKVKVSKSIQTETLLHAVVTAEKKQEIEMIMTILQVLNPLSLAIFARRFRV